MQVKEEKNPAVPRAETAAPSADSDVEADTLHSIRSEATRALAEAHKRLDNAGIPPAQYTVCDDPTCQSLVGHRVSVLVAERDALIKTLEGRAAEELKMLAEVAAENDALREALKEMVVQFEGHLCSPSLGCSKCAALDTANALFLSLLKL